MQSHDKHLAGVENIETVENIEQTKYIVSLGPIRMPGLKHLFKGSVCNFYYVNDDK